MTTKIVLIPCAWICLASAGWAQTPAAKTPEPSLDDLWKVFGSAIDAYCKDANQGDFGFGSFISFLDEFAKDYRENPKNLDMLNRLGIMPDNNLWSSIEEAISSNSGTVIENCALLKEAVVVEPLRDSVAKLARGKLSGLCEDLWTSHQRFEKAHRGATYQGFFDQRSLEAFWYRRELDGTRKALVGLLETVLRAHAPELMLVHDKR